jgi:hypothetical protein
MLESTAAARSLKQMLSTKSDVSAGSQQLYLLDDIREDVDNLLLKDDETISQLAQYVAPTDDGLELAVMPSRNQILLDFVKQRAARSSNGSLSTCGNDTW